MTMRRTVRLALLQGVAALLMSFTGALAAKPNTLWTVPRSATPAPSVVATDATRVYLVEGHHLQARRLLDGKLIWQAGTELDSPLVVERGVVYITGRGRQIHAFDAVSGRKLWSTALTGVPEQAHAGWADTLSLEGNVLLVSSTRGIWGVDARTGRQRWFRELLDARGPLVQVGNVTAWQVSTPLKSFTFGLEVQTGREVWRVQTGATPLLQEDQHVFVTVPGSASAYRMIDVQSGRSIRVNHNFAFGVPSGRQEARAAPGELFVTGTKVCVRVTTGENDRLNCVDRRRGQMTGGDPGLLEQALGEQPVKVRHLLNAGLPAGCVGTAVNTATGVALVGPAGVTETQLPHLPSRAFACFFPISTTLRVVPVSGQLTGVDGKGRRVWTVGIQGRVQQVIPLHGRLLAATSTELRMLSLP
ncbi:PQQ-binding-like beta-propeller repeat protein [Deinococcus sp. DB0503]|uniref:outer membrane protein assembly factor BamB family protein n=1 Tax=Deinococcus sp. DB0503 TaxID=2479203 RepID=UPI001E53EE6D|nr:PQQ-binding-like beta-propeller repeat protein [Deinococcus sp. DB0503]